MPVDGAVSIFSGVEREVEALRNPRDSADWWRICAGGGLDGTNGGPSPASLLPWPKHPAPSQKRRTAFSTTVFMKRMMAISGLVFLFFVLFHAYGNPALLRG